MVDLWITAHSLYFFRKFVGLSARFGEYEIKIDKTISNLHSSPLLAISGLKSHTTLQGN